MADFFRVQLGVVSRSEGHCAAKRSAYQSCGTIVAHDGERFDFRRKAKEHVCTVMLLPDHAPDWSHEPESLWKRAAAMEKRCDAQEARIVDFSMPRQVPEALWEPCIRHVYAPFVGRGMAFQIDIHDTAASDGGRNVNIHGLSTLRPLDGDGFAARKDRSWNDLFRERGGRNVRELFAERLTSFCQQHGIQYEGDARANSARDLPDPEPQLPDWNFEYFERTREMPEALAALHEHRRVRREWEMAKSDEIEADLELDRLETRVRLQHQRRIAPANKEQRPSSRGDRRAAILRAWHKGGWIDVETIPAISAVRIDQAQNLLWIDLADGTILIDRGDAITMKGPVTWSAALETAAAAERHGWNSVQVRGDRAYKDAVTMACMLRGIKVTNYALSPKAQAKFDSLLTERANHSRNSNENGAELPKAINEGSKPSPPEKIPSRSSQNIYLEIAKRTSGAKLSSDDVPNTDQSVPSFKPSFLKIRSKNDEKRE